MNGRPAAAPLLEIDNLSVRFLTRDGIVRDAVEGLSLHVHEGETLSIVGESGCGKSVTAMSVLRLLPMPPAKFESGAIRFEGEDLLQASEERMRDVRGNRISMVFQEPMTSLNPVMSVGRQIAESLELHSRPLGTGGEGGGGRDARFSCRSPSRAAGGRVSAPDVLEGCASG